jgi:hypothetical protein
MNFGSIQYQDWLESISVRLDNPCQSPQNLDHQKTSVPSTFAPEKYNLSRQNIQSM